jgi:hypothetical protein
MGALTGIESSTFAQISSRFWLSAAVRHWPPETLMWVYELGCVTAQVAREAGPVEQFGAGR